MAIAGCAAAEARLSKMLETVDDIVVRRSSRLKDWSVAHVLTHLARNADSLVRMLEAATVGESVPQYAGGAQQRLADIEAGAGRPAAACVSDAVRAGQRLLSAFEDATEVTWAGQGTYTFGAVAPCGELPFRRWRELEFHIVDLGLGYEPAAWPEEFVAYCLPDTLARLPDRVRDASQRRQLLAWVAGRRQHPPEVDFEAF